MGSVIQIVAQAADPGVTGDIKSALGSDGRGRYYGGGRSRAGGFEIPVGFLEGHLDPEQMRMKWEAFDQQIQGRLLRAAGLKEEEDAEG